MYYTYQMREDCLRDEQGAEWIVYGLDAIDAQGHVLFSFADIFFDRESAKNFVQICNEQKVELLHIQEVVDDALVEQYLPI